jgi:hypothetical protein
VFVRYAARVTIGHALDALGDVDLGEPAIQGAVEAAVIDLLEDQPPAVLAQAA